MNKQANWMLASLIVSLVVFFALFPVRLEITLNPTPSAAQDAEADVSYTLRTVIGGEPAMAFVGVGGEIDGVVNPTLTADVGDTISVTVINGAPVIHDFAIDEFNVMSDHLAEQDQQSTVVFTVDRAGEFVYYCTIEGHRQIGMSGTLRVGDVVTNTATGEAIIRNPADVPSSVGDREPTTVRVDLETVEVTGQLADGTTYNYFTFNGFIPGPMIRVRVGDTVDLYLRNADGSVFPHSIDLHAVTGPGGGAVYTQTNPGGETHFSFQALNVGLYVYHCATPSVAHHITNGMYGLILVEPEGGLPPVDREFYVMQGEIYTAEAMGTTGQVGFSHEHMLDEQPTYFVFNGAVMGLTQDDYALRANTGETIRIFFGVGGPNFTSSFHVIGEIFDRVFDQASLTGAPLTDVQTTLVPPGGATMVEFTVEVPGRYILVDHALSRLERGLAAFLYVEGDENPDVFQGDAVTAGSGH